MTKQMAAFTLAIADDGTLPDQGETVVSPCLSPAPSPNVAPLSRSPRVRGMHKNLICEAGGKLIVEAPESR